MNGLSPLTVVLLLASYATSVFALIWIGTLISQAPNDLLRNGGWSLFWAGAAGVNIWQWRRVRADERRTS